MSKSKDIRSFFSVSPKTGAQKLSSKTNGISDTKKKKRRIIESDSDDEPSSPVMKKPKQNDEKKKPESSKYFSASASDIFGSDPVKRVSRSPAKKSKKSEMAIEDHDDAEFEAALLQLDVDSEWIDEKLSLKSKSKENGESSKPTRSPKNSTDSPSKSSTENEECEIDESPPKKIKTSPPKSADKNEESKKDKSSLKRRPESPPKSVPKHEESKKDKFSSQKSDVSKEVESNKIHNKSESQSDVKKEVSNESSVKKSETINSPELKLKAKLQAFAKSKSKSKSDSDKVPDVKKVKTEEEKNSESKRTTLVVSPEKPKTASANKAAAISPEKSVAAISPEKPITASANKATAISPEKPKITSANKAAAISPEKPITASVNKVAAISPEKPKIANTNEASSNVVIDDQLWVEKYKPKSVKQIVGQQGPKSCVAKLTDWLKNWHSNHCGNKKLVRPGPWAKDDDGAYFKAALLSGRPGIGKTTTAHLVCKELGFDMVEFNASDTRSKKLLNQEVTELLSSKSLNPYFSGGHAVSSKHCLVMDEVDGMAGNEDRGGMQELIQLIKTSKVPIICMCNDKTSMKMRSLVNYCFDLPFSKPRIEQLRGALMSICFKEKLKIPKDVLDNIITNCEQDIRLILNHLSMLAANKLNDLEAIKKHVKLGPFEVVKKVFSAEDHKTMTIYDKSDLFFHDYSFAPLFVQENYLGVSPFIPGTAKKSKLMALFADAAESLSYGDLTEKILRSTNNWSLLPTQGMFASVIPGTILEGAITQRINFPAWLGKNSRRSKLDRFSQEIHQHTRLRVSGSKQAITLDYVLPLRDLILQPLIKKGSEGIPQTLAALQAYDLVKEDLESMLELCQWPNKMDPMSQVESKVKAALTRAYNKVGPSCPYAIPSVKKGSKKGGSNDQGELDEMGVDGDVAGVDDDEKDDDSDDGMIVVKKATAKKGGAVKATTSKASTSKTKARGGASRGGKRGKK